MTWPPEDLEAVPACPVCAAAPGPVLYADLEDRVFGVAPGRWTLRRCPTCGCAYLDPRPTPASIARAYASYYTHAGPAPAGDAPSGLRLRIRNGHLNHRFGYRLQPSAAWAPAALALLPGTRRRLERWMRHLPWPDEPAPKLLDVGSGSGQFLAEIAGLGWEARGLEPDPEAAAVARRAGLDVTEGTLPAAAGRLPDQGFAAITMSHVVEHLHDPIASLAAARRLLRPGGTLWLATPNLDALGHRRFERDWLHLDPPRHLVLHTAGSLRRTLEAAGYHDVRVLPTAPNAAEVFPASARIASGGLATAAASTPARTRAAALLADVRAARRPLVAEELVMAARRPGGREAGVDG